MDQHGSYALMLVDIKAGQTEEHAVPFAAVSGRPASEHQCE